MMLMMKINLQDAWGLERVGRLRNGFNYVQNANWMTGTKKIR